MKKFMYHFAFICLLLGVVSCSDSGKEKSATEIADKKIENEASMEAEIKAIDEEISTSGQLLSSFRFSKENAELMLAHAHLSTSGKILKIDEEFNKGNDGDYGMNSYYLHGDMVFASREYYEDRSDKTKPMYVERISFYDKKGKVLKTRERKVDFEEKIDDAPFHNVSPKGIKVDRAKRALNQEGEFEIRFQGFLEANAINYMILGGSEQDDFSTTVRIDQEDAFVRFLLMNESECMGKKLKVSFKNVTDNTGFEYQAYIQGGFVK